MAVTVHKGWIRELPHARTVQTTPGLCGLTEAQVRTLRAVCEHGMYEAAADVLFISTQTVKNHLTSVYRKLGIPSDAHGDKMGIACYRLGKFDERTGQGR